MSIWKKLFGGSPASEKAELGGKWVVRFKKNGQMLFIGESGSVSDPRKGALGNEETQKGLAAFMQTKSVSQQKALEPGNDRSAMIANLAHNLDVMQRDSTLKRYLIFRGYDVDKESESAPTAEAVLVQTAIRDYEAQREPEAPPPQPAPDSPALSTTFRHRGFKFTTDGLYCPLCDNNRFVYGMWFRDRDSIRNQARLKMCVANLRNNGYTISDDDYYTTIMQGHGGTEELSADAGGGFVLWFTSARKVLGG